MLRPWVATGYNKPMTPTPPTPASEPSLAPYLPSWRAGPLRETLLSFVDAVTDPGDPLYVPPAERLAVFDNDGTLWCEKPLMVHILSLIHI